MLLCFSLALHQSSGDLGPRPSEIKASLEVTQQDADPAGAGDVGAVGFNPSVP